MSIVKAAAYRRLSACHFVWPDCLVFSGLRNRPRARAWMDNSTAACDFSSIVQALHNQPTPLPQDASWRSRCILPMFVSATHTGMQVFCFSFLLKVCSSCMSPNVFRSHRLQCVDARAAAVITLAPSSGKRNVKVWRPSVCP